MTANGGPYSSEYQRERLYTYAEDVQFPHLERTSASIAQEWATPPAPLLIKVLDKVQPIVEFAPLLEALLLKDVALRPGLIAATATAIGNLLLTLLLKWNNRRLRWPYLIDAWGIVTFGTLLGMTWYHRNDVHKWLPVASSGSLALIALLALIISHPFTVHPGAERVFPAIADMPEIPDLAPQVSTILENSVWLVTLSAICGITLVPPLTNNTHGYSLVNLLFNFILPPVLLALAMLLLMTQRWCAMWLSHRSTSTTNLLADAGGRTMVDDLRNGKKKDKGISLPINGATQRGNDKRDDSGSKVISIQQLLTKPRRHHNDYQAA